MTMYVVQSNYTGEWEAQPTRCFHSLEMARTVMNDGFCNDLGKYLWRVINHIGVEQCRLDPVKDDE